MATHSLIDGNGVVVNVIVVGQQGLPEDWQAPQGLTLVRADGGQIGGSWNGEAFEPPPEPEPEPPPVPQAVNNSQMRAALAAGGHLTAIQAFIDNLPEPDKTQAHIAWEYGNQIYRVSPLVQAAQAHMQWDDATVDQLFVAAAGIEF